MKYPQRCERCERCLTDEAINAGLKTCVEWCDDSGAW
jgi:hypothetical protein